MVPRCLGAGEDTQAAVQVDLYGGFRELAGTPRLMVKLPDAGTISELLRLLVARYGEEFKETLLQDDGWLRFDAVLLLNQIVLTIRDLGRALRAGDRLTLYQTITGG